ncbi:MAG: M17 family metallopeptidase, partial [Candidatus Competibacterales bacterium]
AGAFCLLPYVTGRPGDVVVGVYNPADPWTCGALPLALPEGDYVLHDRWPEAGRHSAALGWGLGAYQFCHYKKAPRGPARLGIAVGVDGAHLQRQLEALYWTRDLINTPAQDLGPAALAAEAEALGNRFGAEVQVWVGEELLHRGYPAVHAVGRAAWEAPRLVDLHWGDPQHPRVTLVGKGVCFDSGGLDIKPAKGMRLMKKDMGGAAHALGLGQWVMAAALPVRLRVLIPIVENALGPGAFRPGDVLTMGNGLTVEVDNTDAEGRLILADALHAAGAEAPDLLVDFATLTGAARVALGTEVAVMLGNRPPRVEQLTAAGEATFDPLWPLPLHDPYDDLLDSTIADCVNASSSGYGGAITAALFLRRFVPPEVDWLHFDIMAWNVRPRPGRPEGGEAMGLRALFHHLASWATHST